MASETLQAIQRRLGVGTAEAMRIKERAAMGENAIALLARLEPACYNAASWTAWKKDVLALLKRAQG